MVPGDPRAPERADDLGGVAAADVDEPERLAGLVDQDPAQTVVDLAMEEVVVVDHRAVDLPLLVEHRLRRRVLCHGRSLSTRSGSGDGWAPRGGDHSRAGPCT